MAERTEFNKFKNLAQNTLLYTISNFGSKIFTFLIVPLYTYYLTTAEYGTYDTISSLIGLISPMCVFAIHEGLLRWLLKSEENEHTVSNTGLTLYTLFIFATDIIFFVVFKYYKWEYSNLFIICLTSTTLFEVLQFTARGLKKNFSFAISGVIQTITMLVLNVAFVIFLKIGIAGMLISLATSQFIGSLYLFISIKDCLLNNKYCFKTKLAKEMLIYSILLVPNNISWWIMNSSDRLMLTAMIGSSYTGIYSIACKFPSLYSMIHTIFYRAWQEQAVIEYDSKGRDSYFTKIFNFYMRFGFCMVLILIPTSKIFIQFFMSTEYKEAYIYIGILIIGALFCSFSSFYGTGYISAKDTKNATFTTLIGAVTNCLINLLFIRIIGIWAACLSTLLGYLVTWIVRIKQTKKYFDITIDWKIFWILLMLSSIFAILVTFRSFFVTMIMLLFAIIISVIINKEIIYMSIKFIRKKIDKRK